MSANSARSGGELNGRLAPAGSISVVIPTYGHAAYIGQALESVFAQSRQPAEIIVINDGSPDETRAAVAPYLDRIDYIEQENQGIARTRTRAINVAAGDYVLMLDSDDWLEERALERLGEVLDQHLDVGLAHGGMYRADAAGHVDRRSRPGPNYPRGKHREVERLIRENYLRVPSTLCRRTALVQAAPFPNYGRGEDWGMWIKIALDGWYLYGIEPQVFNCRRHATNLTARKNALIELDENLALLDELATAYRGRLSDGEEQAFAWSRHWIARNRGWRALAVGRRAEARRAFARSTRHLPNANAAAGLLLSVAPTGVYSALSRWRQLPT